MIIHIDSVRIVRGLLWKDQNKVLEYYESIHSCVIYQNGLACIIWIKRREKNTWVSESEM